MCMYHASWERRAEVAHVHRRSQPHNCAMGRPPTFFSVGGPVSGWYGSAYTRMKAWIERRQAGSDRLLPVSQSQCRRKRSLVVESRISKACTRPNRRTSTADIRNGSTSTCRNINRRVTRAATFPHAPVRGCRQRGVEVWPTSWDRLHAHQGSRARDTLAWRPRPVGRPCRAVLVPRQGGERAPRAEAPSLHPSPTCHCGNLLYSVAWDHESLSRGCHPPPPTRLASQVITRLFSLPLCTRQTPWQEACRRAGQVSSSLWVGGGQPLSPALQQALLVSAGMGPTGYLRGSPSHVGCRPAPL